MRSVQQAFESAFEWFLFNSRLIVILAVLGSLTSSVLMFVRGAILIVHSAKDFAHHWNDAHSDDLSIALISSVDSFLFATVLLIFAMGIYELFISKIDPASRTSESRPNWLQIHSLDDLKGAVGKVILMILIVRLFESAVKMKYDHPLHLLYLGLAVLFVAASLYLQHLGHKHERHSPGGTHDDAGHSYPPPLAHAAPVAGGHPTPPPPHGPFGPQTRPVHAAMQPSLTPQPPPAIAPGPYGGPSLAPHPPAPHMTGAHPAMPQAGQPGPSPQGPGAQGPQGPPGQGWPPNNGGRGW